MESGFCRMYIVCVRPIYFLHQWSMFWWGDSFWLHTQEQSERKARAHLRRPSGVDQTGRKDETAFLQQNRVLGLCTFCNLYSSCEQNTASKDTWASNQKTLPILASLLCKHLFLCSQVGNTYMNTNHFIISMCIIF